MKTSDYPILSFSWIDFFLINFFYLAAIIQNLIADPKQVIIFAFTKVRKMERKKKKNNNYGQQLSILAPTYLKQVIKEKVC